MRFTIGFAKQVWAGLLVLLALTVVLGVVYPAAVWGVSRSAPDLPKAHRSPMPPVAWSAVPGWVSIRRSPKGSRTRSFTIVLSDPFRTRIRLPPVIPLRHCRPTRGPSSEILAGFVIERRAAIAAREGVDPASVPVDAVTGSGSGIDPHISPAYAELQVARVAANNGISEDQVRDLVAEHTDGRQLGFLGAERVNVLELNLALGLTAPTCAAPTTGG